MINRVYKFCAFAFIVNGILLIINILNDGDVMPLIAFCTGVCFANLVNATTQKRCTTVN